MKLARVHIKNFRLLVDTSLGFECESPTTILVGPNNSGKTSVAEALQLFTNPGARLTVSDFSAVSRAAFHVAEQQALQQAATAAGADTTMPEEVGLPAITVRLVFDYDDVAEDLIAVTELLMDLDAEKHTVAIEIEFAAKDTAATLKRFAEERAEGESLPAFLDRRLHDVYGFFHYKVDAATGARERLANGNALSQLLRVDFVAAQRHIDDQEATKATRLSTLIHRDYNRRQKASGGHDVSELEKALGTHSLSLTELYKTTFAPLVSDLARFGYPQKRTPQLSIKAELRAESVLKESTRLYYAATDVVGTDDAVLAFELPEKYNGLGFKNLIYMVLQITAFREEARDADPRPRVHLIVIEEPEVHLHPQVQSVFIKRVAEFLTGSDPGVDVQLLVTTHSSHIVGDSGFAPVRYFRRHGNAVQVKDLLAYKHERERANDAAAVRFLAQYLTQTRCDLLFADKAILIEGQVERLLLPVMMTECATGPAASLLTDYISVVEVGGAYAHLFRSLLEFLEVPTLVITDIDSVGGDRRRCRVADGTATSNQTLKAWLPGSDDLAVLRAASDVAKTNHRVRVAYQVPDADDLPCGRSFEEAFIYRNMAWLLANRSVLIATGDCFDQASADALRNAAFDLALDKVDFALDLMLAAGWRTPKYIEEGLQWLASQDHA